MTLFGLLLGIASIFGSFLLEGGKLSGLILIPAMMIVFGGTVATAFIGTSKEIVFKCPAFLKIAFNPPNYDTIGIIETITEMTNIARREGILSLENKAKDIQNPFFKKIIMLAVDGLDTESIKNIAENEIAYINERHNANASLFAKMGGYSPTMGIIGTVMGLISTLSHAGGDPEEMIRGIASAFIATLWGVFMANVVYLPIADRLKSVNNDEKIFLEIIVEGIASIQSGENPSVTKTKLYSLLPESVQKLHRE